MKISVSIELAADPAAVLDALHSERYLELAAPATGRLRAEIEQREEQGGTLIVATRWYAPTKLPRILTQYEGRAPESVNWLERLTWDLTTFTATLEVTPDMPASWRTRYRSSGVLRIEATPGGARLHQDLEFTMDLGLIGRALEKLLHNEIEALLTQRLGLLRQLLA